MNVPTNDASYSRDSTSGALINTNVAAYTLFKQQRSHAYRAADMKQEIDTLKAEIGELKLLIGHLIKNGSNINTN